jgi:hypothetical protein
MGALADDVRAYVDDGFLVVPGLVSDDGETPDKVFLRPVE